MWEHPSNTHIKRQKAKYKEMYFHVESLVNEWDPIGLIDGGAPKDEYDCVSIQLIDLLIQGKKSAEIFEFIIHELDNHFGLGINSIAEEYKERFIYKHKDFSEQITTWYLNYKQENESNFEKG